MELGRRGDLSYVGIVKLEKKKNEKTKLEALGLKSKIIGIINIWLIFIIFYIYKKIRYLLFWYELILMLFYEDFGLLIK